MLHRVCLLHHRGSPELNLHHRAMPLFVLRMDSASSAASRVIRLKIAIRVRINCLSLATTVATTSPATLMDVVKLTTLMLKKLKSNLTP